MNNKEIIKDLRSTINILEEILSKNDLIDLGTYHIINNSRIAIDLLDENLQIARNQWGEGSLSDLIEEQASYQDLVDDFEG